MLLVEEFKVIQLSHGERKESNNLYTFVLLGNLRVRFADQERFGQLYRDDIYLGPTVNLNTYLVLFHANYPGMSWILSQSSM